MYVNLDSVGYKLSNLEPNPVNLLIYEDLPQKVAINEVLWWST